MKNGEWPFRLVQGFDLVDIAGFDRLINHPQYGHDLLEALFTPEELRRYGHKTDSLAARVAAKEAVGKILGGLPWDSWQEIEVLDEKNAAVVNLSGSLRKIADEEGLRDLAVSLAHEHEYGNRLAGACATAIFDKKSQT